jgi:Ran GTPase-activating protein (RanGAP) involved in mRNA processing and transport
MHRRAHAVHHTKQLEVVTPWFLYRVHASFITIHTSFVDLKALQHPAEAVLQTTLHPQVNTTSLGCRRTEGRHVECSRLIHNTYYANHYQHGRLKTRSELAMRSGNKTAYRLADALKENASLTKIDLWGKKIGDEGAAALADALKVNTSVKAISLYSNAIGKEGASALADALRVNTTVTTLNLNSNAIGNEGAAALVDVLKVNSSVTTLELGVNEIGAEGAAALDDALKVNTSVTKIYLYSNGIGAEGAAALADALKVNTSVMTLNLGYNEIGNEGAAALADGLQVDTSVTRIALDGNYINASNRANVNELIARNERFRFLFLFDARQMLLSLMCADECGVVWPYLLGSGNTDGTVVPDNVDSIRAEFATVVEERRRRL